MTREEEDGETREDNESRDDEYDNGNVKGFSSSNKIPEERFSV
jgi:hypothetical protein